MQSFRKDSLHLIFFTLLSFIVNESHQLLRVGYKHVSHNTSVINGGHNRQVRYYSNPHVAKQSFVGPNVHAVYYKTNADAFRTHSKNLQYHPHSRLTVKFWPKWMELMRHRRQRLLFPKDTTNDIYEPTKNYRPKPPTHSVPLSVLGGSYYGQATGVGFGSGQCGCPGKVCHSRHPSICVQATCPCKGSQANSCQTHMLTPIKCGCELCCPSTADIILVIDESGSINNKYFKESVNFAMNLAKRFIISENDYRFGIVAYKEASRVVHRLTDSQTPGAVERAISSIRYMQPGGTVVIDPIRDMIEMFSKQKSTGRRQIGILISDGRSYPSQSREAGAIIRSKGILMFAVRVGEGIDHEQLSDIASDPDHAFVFNATHQSMIYDRITRESSAKCRGTCIRNGREYTWGDTFEEGDAMCWCDDSRVQCVEKPPRKECGCNADSIETNDGMNVCFCRPGFTGNPYQGCVDINECDSREEQCGCNANCKNNPGGYSCSCRIGSVGNPYTGCKDIMHMEEEDYCSMEDHVMCRFLANNNENCMTKEVFYYCPKKCGCRLDRYVDRDQNDDCSNVDVGECRKEIVKRNCPIFCRRQVRQSCQSNRGSVPEGEEGVPINNDRCKIRCICGSDGSWNCLTRRISGCN
ncbi:hypothetical protein SNEBB_005655 [Seison nebaliae]|nr:hypothetical protein SNEBB_005655 [Seison nebaliae]